MIRACNFRLVIRDHSFNTYAKFSEKLAFLTPLYAHTRTINE